MISTYEKANRTKVLAAVAVLAMVACVFVAMPVDETDAAGNDITYVSGVIDKPMSFVDGNKVVVDKDLTITNEATLTIGDGAKFTVNEGVTVTVNTTATDKTGASKLIISAFADVDVNGTIVVGEKGAIDMVDDTTTDGTYTPAADFKNGFNVNGTITFQNGSVSEFTGTESEIILGSTGVMNVTSIGTKISQIGNFTLTLMPGATFNMRGMATGAIDVQAVGEGYPYAADGKQVGVAASVTIGENNFDADAKITSAKVSNLVFVGSATSATAYDGNNTRITVETAVLTVSGTIQNNDTLTTASELVTYKDADKKDVEFESQVVIADTLTVGQTGTFNFDSIAAVSGTVNVATGNNNAGIDAGKISLGTNADVTVTGTITINDSDSYIKPGTAAGKLVIDGGSVSVADATIEDLNLADLYGAYYVVTAENSTSTLKIVDLQVAIDAAAADNTIYEITVSGLASSLSDENYKGAYAVEQSFTVPAGVQFVVKNVLLVPEEYTITVPENAFVTVEGAIVAQGAVTDSSLTLTLAQDTSGNGVICEVRIITNDGATITYTSLKLAIANATAGDVIELAGNADIKENLTIPADITVVVGTYTMSIDNGVTLTVDGVLNDENNKLSTDAKTDEKAAGTVVVNNYIITGGNVAYGDNYNVSGVYFSAEIEGIDAQNFIASVPVFAGYSADIIDTASVKGTVAVNEDITLTAGDRASYVLSIDGTAKFSTVNLSGYQIVISADGLMSGVVAADGNSVELKNIKGSTTVTVANVIDENDGTNQLTIAGTPAKVDKDGKVTTDAEKNVAELSATAGTATIVGTFDAKNLVSFGVSEGTTVDVIGTLTVSDIEIAGTANVLDEGKVNAANIIVTGTLNIVNKDSDNPVGGTVTCDNLYIGTDKKFETQNAATVTGDAIAFTQGVNGVIYVSAASTLTSEVTEDLRSVGFYVEDALWMTVYGNAQTTTAAIEAPVEDAVFKGWYNTEDSKKEIIAGNAITIGAYDSVTADIEYDIYIVQVVADNGVGTVAIDGVVLIKSSNMFVYNGYLAAGSHTISIDVKNGYSADNVEIQVNGQTITGDTFTLSGTPEGDATTVTVTITVSGTTVADTVVVEEDGMGITDYLLIILVVLVIVLAIVVVMRMMRS